MSRYIYIYMCVYVYIYTYHIYIHTNTNIYIYIYIYTCIHVCALIVNADIDPSEVSRAWRLCPLPSCLVGAYWVGGLERLLDLVLYCPYPSRDLTLGSLGALVT